MACASCATSGPQAGCSCRATLPPPCRPCLSPLPSPLPPELLLVVGEVGAEEGGWLQCTLRGGRRPLSALSELWGRLSWRGVCRPPPGTAVAAARCGEVLGDAALQWVRHRGGLMSKGGQQG